MPKKERDYGLSPDEYDDLRIIARATYFHPLEDGDQQTEASAQLSHPAFSDVEKVIDGRADTASVEGKRILEYFLEAVKTSSDASRALAVPSDSTLFDGMATFVFAQVSYVYLREKLQADQHLVSPNDTKYIYKDLESGKGFHIPDGIILTSSEDATLLTGVAEYTRAQQLTGNMRKRRKRYATGRVEDVYGFQAGDENIHRIRNRVKTLYPALPIFRGITQEPAQVKYVQANVRGEEKETTSPVRQVLYLPFTSAQVGEFATTIHRYNSAR